MSLTMNEQYASSFVYLLGGTLSVVSTLWLIFDFLSVASMPRNSARLHKNLAFANLLVVAPFFIGTVTSFEKRWVFGDFLCMCYTGWSKFGVISAAGSLAACLWGEHQRHFNPRADKSNMYTVPILLAWINGILWGVLSVTWSTYGVEKAGFTCCVHWMKVNSYTLTMVFVGCGVPLYISYYLAYKLWTHGKTLDDSLTASAVGICGTFFIQISGYVLGYVAIVMGYSLPLRIYALIPLMVKAGGTLHPAVYSRVVYLHSQRFKDQ